MTHTLNCLLNLAPRLKCVELDIPSNVEPGDGAVLGAALCALIRRGCMVRISSAIANRRPELRAACAAVCGTLWQSLNS